MAYIINQKCFFKNRHIAILVCLLLSASAFAKSEITLPIYNPSFEDWNDAYPLSTAGWTTSVPSGWDLGWTGYYPCDAVVKSHTCYSARTGEYAAFFNSNSYSNYIISNKYQLSEGTYTFSVYAANIGSVNTVLNLSVIGAVTKNAKFNVKGSNGSYTKYSLSFDMETNGDVQFKIDNSKAWDGNTTVSHFSVDDWSLTTSDGKLVKSYDAVEINGISYYFYNNGNAEVIGVASSIASELTIPETVINNDQTYIVRDIAPYAFKDCGEITKIILPKRLYNIGEAAFEGCTNLKVAILPTYLSSIGANAFANCTGLSQVIVMAKSKPTISNGSFPDHTTLYVPDPKLYQSVHSKVFGMGFLNSDLYYTGVMPNISIVCPEGISYGLLDQSKLGKNAGAYTLNATFSGYGMSVDGSFEITINKAPLSVKAPTLTRVYGDTNPVIELVYSGFVNNETESDLNIKPQVTVNSTSKSDVGNYDIIISNAVSPNYDISYINGMLTVIPANLSVAVKNSIREYGVVNPVFSLNYTGLKNQETEPEWVTQPAFTTTALISSNVGQYDISVSCVPKNYKIVENASGVLTVTKAPLTLKANNKSKVYYDLNPAFDYVLIGLRNQDDINCITQQPTFNCEAVQSSDCGEYTIAPVNARAANYDIEHVSGVLTVQQAELTISVSNVICEYGEQIPQISYQLTGLKGSDNDSSIFIDRPYINCDAHIGSNAGEYAVTIKGGTTKNYNLKYNDGKLTITKAPLSVSVVNSEKIYGSDNPSFIRNYLGFKLSDTETSAFSMLPKITCYATKSSDVGNYPINITGGSARNYEIVSYENGTLTINKAKATISANNKSRLYFEDNPQFDLTVTGLLNGDTESCLTTLPSYNCDANILSNVGNYQIVPSDAVAKNYYFEYTPGNLTINKRQLTASVGNYSRAFGEDNPNFEINYNGFVNNEDQSVLTESATVSCSATSLSDVGSYPIEIVGGDATNYRISKYNSGTLTITKANQSINWNQDLSNIELYSQVELTATSDANLPITYEMSPNNVATLYSNYGKWYLDCYGSGAVNIRATQDGDKNHNAAATASKTLVVFGGSDDPSNPQIFLNVDEPGTLPSMIAENRKYQVKNLRLTGNLNGTDINFIREMAGSDSYGNSTPGVLETLDISGCSIVSGGRSYYQSNRTCENVIGNYMFYNCKVLTTLRIPDNTISIGDFALADCERLSVISIPNCVKSYGEQSFSNDISLPRLPMSNELERIGDMAFSGCNRLTEILIPSSVTSIGSGIVKDCQNIAQINVEAGNTNYASRDGVLFNSNFDELIIFPVNHSVSEYVVPEGVIRVSSYAFVSAKGLKLVNLPSSLSTIGQDAFIGCVNLNTLQVQALTPPTCQNDCFDNISKTRCELQVPIGCRSYYWVAPVWSEFNKIVETDFSGIEDIYYDNLQVGIINGRISVSGCPDNMTVRIYHINGTLIYQEQANKGEIEFEPASHDMYIVMIGNKAFKLMVK